MPLSTNHSIWETSKVPTKGVQCIATEEEFILQAWRLTPPHRFSPSALLHSSANLDRRHPGRNQKSNQRTMCNTPARPEFSFEMSEVAAEKILCILAKYEMDLSRALDAQKHSPLGYQTVHRAWITLKEAVRSTRRRVFKLKQES